MVDIKKLALDPDKVLDDIADTNGFSVQDTLDEMSLLAEDIGDWRGHLPYQAALTYFEDKAVHKQFISHVDQCKYCRTLVDTIHPSEDIIKSFKQIIKEENASQKENVKVWRGRPALPYAMLLLGLLSGPGIYYSIENMKATSYGQSVEQASLAYEHIGSNAGLVSFDNTGVAFLETPKLDVYDRTLVNFDNLNTPMSKFHVVSSYTVAEQANTPYEIIGQDEISSLNKREVQVPEAPKLNVNNEALLLE